MEEKTSQPQNSIPNLNFVERDRGFLAGPFGQDQTSSSMEVAAPNFPGWTSIPSDWDVGHVGAPYLIRFGNHLIP